MFKVGDSVKWTSQSKGYIREKSGIVVEILPEDRCPKMSDYPELYKGPGPVLEESMSRIL